jgi:hypothetical protein
MLEIYRQKTEKHRPTNINKWIDGWMDGWMDGWIKRLYELHGSPSQ